MPSVVLSSFLRLYRFFSFFSQSVSMPSVVLSSFLHHRYITVDSIKEGVNALSRAFFISTPFTSLATKTLKGVNALSRAFFISTILISKQTWNSPTCQCPQSCFLHFYGHAIQDAGVFIKRVNALSRAFFISTS